MLAQSAKPIQARVTTAKIINSHLYNENGINKISFDVIVYQRGSEFVEMGNSSFLFTFPQYSLINPVVNFKGYLSGYNTFVKLIAGKYLMVQYFADGGGWIFDTQRQGEIIFSVTMEVRNLDKFYLIWNYTDSAIVDRNLNHIVKNNFEGKFELE